MKSRASNSIQTSDEGGNGLYVASNLTQLMPIKIKFYPSKGWVAG